MVSFTLGTHDFAHSLAQSPVGLGVSQGEIYQYVSDMVQGFEKLGSWPVRLRYWCARLHAKGVLELQLEDQLQLTPRYSCSRTFCLICNTMYAICCEVQKISFGTPAALIDKARSTRLGVDQPRCKQHCLDCEVGEVVSYVQLGSLNMAANHRATNSSNL
jgi:hypothetical protein